MLEDIIISRTVLCVCPCCGEIQRLSDLRLRYMGKTPRTWVDDFEKKVLSLQKKEEGFEEKEDELREKAREGGRKLAEKAIMKLVNPGLNRLGLNPFDVKAILHPVDYVAFVGMDKKEKIDEVLFLAGKDKELASLREGIRKSIDKKAYNWQVIRIKEDGAMELE